MFQIILKLEKSGIETLNMLTLKNKFFIERYSFKIEKNKIV